MLVRFDCMKGIGALIRASLLKYRFGPSHRLAYWNETLAGFIVQILSGIRAAPSSTVAFPRPTTR